VNPIVSPVGSLVPCPRPTWWVAKEADCDDAGCALCGGAADVGGDTNAMERCAGSHCWQYLAAAANSFGSGCSTAVY